MSTHMAPDVGAREPRVKDILDRFLADQLALVADAVRAGRLDGTLRTDLAPKQAALMVVSAISGIRVLAQAGTMPAELRKVADLHIGLPEGVNVGALHSRTLPAFWTLKYITSFRSPKEVH